MKKITIEDTAFDQLLAAYSRGDKFSVMTGQFGLSPYAINSILKAKGIPKRFSFTDQDILTAYSDGLTYRQIGKRYHTHADTISKVLKKHGKTIRDNRKYSIDESVFDNMDENLAYFLGLFCADGWIYQKSARQNYYAFGVTLHADDIDLLYKIRAWMKTEQPLEKPQHSNCYNLRITHKGICEKIDKLGLGHKKYNRLSIPSLIPDHLLRHFVRGAYDGDGSIRRRKGSKQLRFSICGYKPFLLELRRVILQQTGIDTGFQFMQYNSDGSEFGSINKAGNRSSLAIYDWMYGECCLKMTRKYDIYLKHKEVYEAWKKSQEIYEVDDNGCVVATYPSKIAASKSLGIRSDSISECIRGMQHTAGGRKFVGNTKLRLHKSLSTLFD